MHRNTATVLLWIALSSPCYAQQAMVQRTTTQYVSETQGISFQELAEAALSRNKDLIAARESLRQAAGRLAQARLRPNPSIDVFTRTDAIFANEGDNNFSVILSQPFELGGKRSKRIQVEEVSIEVTKAEIADAERQLLGRLRSTYVQAIGAASRVDLFQRLDGLNQQMVSVMDVRLRVGDASRLDARLLAAQTNQVHAQQAVAENHLAGFMLQIRTLAGMAPGEPLLLKRPQPMTSLGETEEGGLSRAIASRPDLKAAKLREELAEAGVTLAKSQAVPNLTGFVGYGRESQPTLSVGAQRRSFVRESVLELGVSIPLPLFNRAQGNVAEAASRRLQARGQSEALEATIRQDVLLALRRLETAQRTLEILERGVVQPNQESFQIVRFAHNLGDQRLIDVVNQQRVLIDAETNFVDAQTEFNAALADLEFAIGGGAR